MAKVRLADYRQGFVRLRIKEGARWEWVNFPMQAPPCLDQSSLAALQSSQREVLTGWARLPEPLPLWTLRPDGPCEHRGGLEPEAEVGSNLPVSFRRGKAGHRSKSPPEGGRSREPSGLTGNGGGPRQVNDGWPCGLLP